MSEQKQYMLDPFSAAIRLGLLTYLPAGVKIGARTHFIELYSNTIVDWMRRTYFHRIAQEPGLNREWLHNLRLPVLRARMWYAKIAPTVLEDVQCGLVKLKESYQDSHGGNARAAIDLAISVLRQDLDTAADGIVVSDGIRSTLEALRQVWTEEEIRVVEGMFKMLRVNPVKFNHMVQCLETLVHGKEAQVLLILRE